MTIKEYEEQNNAIMKGLEEAYEKMLEFKIYKKTPVVVMREGVIVYLDAKEELERFRREKAKREAANK